MNAEQYLKYLVEEIHTAVVATVDGEDKLALIAEADEAVIDDGKIVVKL